jgi:hypothetical protein
MRLALIATLVAVASAAQVPSASQAPAPKVQVTFEEGGLVTLIANGATVREILAEWARKGGSTFVNSERLTGTPLTLQFTHQPEKDVMASLLRQAAGYVLGPRRAGTIGASSFEVVYILPTSNPSAGGYVPQQTTYQQPQFSSVGSPDDELAPVGRGAPPPQGAPGPQPPPQPAPDYRPSAPGASGVAVPVVPVVPITTTPPSTTGTTGTTGTSGS